MKPSNRQRTAPSTLRGVATLTLASLTWAFGVAQASAMEDGVEANHYRPAKPAIVSVSKIFTLEQSGEAPTSGASTITRTDAGVGFEYVASDLKPNAPYTMWYVVFNRPRKCIMPFECGIDDLNDPRVRPGVFWAGGRVSDEYGQAMFAGEINYGELPKGEDQIPFPGLESPIKRGAEIHLVVRAHGPALDDPAALKEQLTQFNGGCPPNDGCIDVQASVHPSPFARKKYRLH
ncbi:MAG: hypothetical protein AAGC95_05460 [Pseudomonadota bacterium]